MPSRHLPTMTSLRVVAAIAQHGTVSGAAAALNLTQSAVSKQLKSVEQIAGTPLFVRHPHGLAPTPAGLIYTEQARVALGAMETAAARTAALLSPRLLRLHVLPILGDRWFMSRFPGFLKEQPDIDVQFTSFAGADSLNEADIAFRFGAGDWPGWSAEYFFGRDILLVGSPGMIARDGPFENPAQITRFALLEHPHTPLHWSDFATSHGLGEIAAMRKTRLGYYSLVIRAAIAGQGLALVPRSLILDELASGTLTNPLGLGFASANVYWLTMPTDRPASQDALLFREWALKEARQTEA